jgi:endo-1,4-beta-D-glucanase Y
MPGPVAKIKFVRLINVRAKACMAFLSLCCGAGPAVAAEKRPFPMGLTYPGCIKPGNVDQTAMNKAVLDAWTLYKSKYIKAATSITGGYYIEMRTTNAPDKDKSSSEANGYGMILAALMAGPKGEADAQTYFDGFFRLFDKNRSGTNSALMSFSVGPGENSHQNAATDGDMDIAYALLLADYQWGSGGAVNYLTEAKRIITEGIKKSEMGQSSHRTTLGDWDKNGLNTRSSDWMAGHMTAFQKATGDAFWGDARKTIFDLVQAIGAGYSSKTGLMPDFVVGDPAKPAAPNFLEKETDGDYSWNACRFPLRMAVDYAHNGSAESKSALAKISSWINGAASGNPASIMAGYKLDGTALVTYGNMAFTAPLIAASIAGASNQDFLNKGWAYLASTRQNEYYGDSIALLTLLLLSGNWWAPEAVLPTGLAKGRSASHGLAASRLPLGVDVSGRTVSTPTSITSPLSL